MSSEREHLLWPYGKDINAHYEVNEKLGYIDSMTELVDPERRIDKFAGMVAAGYYPILYSNHNQHANIQSIRRIWNSMHTRPNKLHVVVAASLQRKEQDKNISDFSEKLENVLRPEGIEFLSFVRPKDLSVYRDALRKGEDGQNGSIKSNDDIREVIRQTKNNKKILFSTLHENVGLGVFPEATTESAYKQHFWTRRPGLQEVTTPLFSELFQEAEKIGRHIALLPFANVNTHRILEPRKHKPRLRPIIEIGRQRLGYEPARLAQIVIGQPLTISEVCSQVDIGDVEQVNMNLMKRVAALMPQEARGFYR